MNYNFKNLSGINTMYLDNLYSNTVIENSNKGDLQIQIDNLSG